MCVTGDTGGDPKPGCLRGHQEVEEGGVQGCMDGHLEVM